MKGRRRIAIVVFVLIGGTASLGYWSINQFNHALDTLSTSYLLAYTHSTYLSFKQKVELASTSPEISGELATSTDPELPSTSPQKGDRAYGEFATSTDPELSFTFPKEGDEVYIDCIYQISWQSSTTINSLETALIDAGTREPAGPVASGLAKENTIDRDLQNLKWKVGVVWPGAYYIKVSGINGVEAEFRSEVFKINKMSENISTGEKENICKGSMGPAMI